MKNTIKNLAKAFIGESQARNRYNYYAKTAKKEGFEKIAEIFILTAEQEKEHAKWLLRMINSLKQRTDQNLNEILVDAGMPTIFGDTKENLKSAIAGEHYEHTEMYPKFAEEADREGLSDVAERLRAIAKAEEHHEERYGKLLKQVEAGTMFKKDNKVWWVCRECGYVHYAEEAPENCPSCGHPQAYYEVKCEDY